jgi:hypothetical protein
LRVVKIWITDGSGVPFTDIATLTAHHRGMLGRDVPYKGALDENVPVGNASVFMQDPTDCLVPEAEWCIWFPGGTDPFADDPETLTESTPIVLQGMIEGKWLNRFGEDLAFKPVSLDNNLLAQGPGISGTLASLEDGGMQGEIRVQHTGRAGLQAYASALDDLRGHDVLGLARAVIAHCREQSVAVEAVDCSAVGPDSALVQDRRFLQQVMTAAEVAPQELSNPSAWKRLAPEITKIAIGEGLVVEPGQPIALIVTAGTDTVGRGQMTVHPTRDTAP